ncbi:hypothetical protein L6452_44760 [Arctium lappa]|nr:hypothetical protein L6452_44760 [Arctium lappa]
MVDDKLGGHDKAIEEGHESQDCSVHGTSVSPELPMQKEIAVGETVVTREEDVSAPVLAWWRICCWVWSFEPAGCVSAILSSWVGAAVIACSLCGTA